jgi:hypothetical protein
MILIVTVKDDLHALTVKGALLKKGYTDCHILECDQIAVNHSIHFNINHTVATGLLYLPNKVVIDVEAIKIIWWRRVRADQQIEGSIADNHQIKLINNDCRGALAGVLEANFTGKWVSNPGATDKASNKIYQLSIAKKHGFTIPDTLISQSKNEVKIFAEKLDGQVIVKPVVGAAGPLMFTEFIGNVDRFENM